MEFENKKKVKQSNTTMIYRDVVMPSIQIFKEYSSSFVL